MLVELACSTTLAPAYKPALFNKLVPIKQASAAGGKKTVVFIVCGGFKVSLDDAADYRRVVDQDIEGNGGVWRVFCDDGKPFQVEK
jgi:L-serine/L-threonine ammonia-lyase